ncbi:MAG TPA: ribosome silencing factor [Candidatus Binataceae bacterium]|nr:ribosome silencing factor [Candidatus Binataceae bacterium]
MTDTLTQTFTAVEAALEKKAYDLRVVQVPHLQPIADYFVIATGRSDVQVQAIARGIEERMALRGLHPLAIEGFNLGHWIILDYGDFVIHVFFEPSREFYRLESTWSDAEEVPLPEPLRRQAQELRLGALG